MWLQSSRLEALLGLCASDHTAFDQYTYLRREAMLLEPEDAPLLQDEPTAAPRLDVLPLLHKPTLALWGCPELHTFVTRFVICAGLSQYQSFVSLSGKRGMRTYAIRALLEV